MMVGVYDAAGEPVRAELVAAFERAWREIAGPGSWWDGPARVAIAECTRAARAGAPASDGPLPPAAVEAASRLSREPATTTEEWVTGVCEAIGELRYVELVGIVVRVTAIDTFHRLTGRPLAPIPDPEPGAPSQEPAPDGMKRNHTWVSMAMPLPPFVLGAVPAAMAAMNDLSHVLYMPMEQMADPDWRRGELHRSQVELVAAATSHVNECFY